MLTRGLAPIACFAVLALGWQLIASHSISILPPLGAVGIDLLHRPVFYLTNLWVTVRAALAGFVGGGCVALVLAVAIDRFAILSAAIMPAALLLNVTPVVAIAPALIVAFGFGAVPHIIVASISAFFPMLINTVSGLRAADPQALEVFASMAASWRDVLLRLKLPSSLPNLFTGARLSISAAMVGSIVSEFTGTSRGIGATIVAATMFLNLTQMWAAIFVSAIASLLLIGGVGAIERRVIRW